MSTEPKCPKCQSEYAYAEGNLLICPECSFEWTPRAAKAEAETKAPPIAQGVVDAFGNPLVTGDSVTVIKDLKVKGSSSSVKVGTKVKNIRIVDSTDGHNISCKIDGIGSMHLKSEFVKKA
jgi:protein PhnA